MISVSFSKSMDERDHVWFRTIDEISIKRLADISLESKWSPIVWAGGYRAGRNFVEAQYCALDFDKGQLLNEVSGRLMKSGLVHFITSTRHHNIEKKGIIAERFRVVIPLNSKITDKDHYCWFMDDITRKIGYADESASDAARSFNPGRELIQIVEDGNKLIVPSMPSGQNLSAKMERYERYSSLMRRYGASKIIPRWIKNDLISGFPVGERNAKTFKLTCNLVRMGLGENEIIDLLFRSNINLPKSEIVDIARKAKRYNK